jgi:hypothetical protein
MQRALSRCVVCLSLDGIPSGFFWVFPAVRRLCLILALGTLSSACTSYRTWEGDQQALASGIRAGDLVAPGDRIRVALADGEKVAFKVIGLDDTTIAGAQVDVPIDEIRQLESKDFDPVKTGALVGGVTLGTVGLIMVALSSMTFLVL